MAAQQPEQRADHSWSCTAGSVPVTPDPAAVDVPIIACWNSAEHWSPEVPQATVAGQLSANVVEQSASSLQQWQPFADVQQALAAPAPAHHVNQHRSWPQQHQPGSDQFLQHQHQHQHLPPPGASMSHVYAPLQDDPWQQQSQSMAAPVHVSAPQPHWRQQAHQHNNQPQQYGQRLYDQQPH